jgi:hypothetical protein
MKSKGLPADLFHFRSFVSTKIIALALFTLLLVPQFSYSSSFDDEVRSVIKNAAKAARDTS